MLSNNKKILDKVYAEEKYIPAVIRMFVLLVALGILFWMYKAGEHTLSDSIHSTYEKETVHVVKTLPANRYWTCIVVTARGKEIVFPCYKYHNPQEMVELTTTSWPSGKVTYTIKNDVIGGN